MMPELQKWTDLIWVSVRGYVQKQHRRVVTEIFLYLMSISDIKG